MMLVGVLALAACQPAPTPTLPPTPSPPPVPTAVPVEPSPTPSPTVTPTRTPTSTPTATPTRPPTLTPTPLATSTLAGSQTPPPTPRTFELIRSFEAAPAEIEPGDDVTLTWSAQGDSAWLYRLDPRGTLGTYYGVVPLAGTLTVETDERDRNVVRYVLFVQQGDTVESAMASVAVRCTAAWFFPVEVGEEPSICPADAVIETDAAAERFEGGLMIWLGALARIYVLYDDAGIPAYSVTADPWEPGLPESDPSIVPPEGRYQPVRGFGMVWRGEVLSATNVRGRLGWALEPEFGYRAAFQCDSAARYVTCYLRGPDGAVIVLKPEGSGWEVRR